MHSQRSPLEIPQALGAFRAQHSRAQLWLPFTFFCLALSACDGDDLSGARTAGSTPEHTFPSPDSDNGLPVPAGDACDASAPSSCVGDGQLKACVDGRWVTTFCTHGCRTAAAGPFCKALPASQTTFHRGTVSYEFKVPNADRTDWSSTPSVSAAPGFLVLSRIPDPARPGKMAILDAVVTNSTSDTPGAFSIEVRASGSRANDDLVVLAAAADPATGRMRYAVADPKLAPGTYGAFDPTPRNPRIWSWSLPLGTSPQSVRIPIERGASAARVFDWLRYFDVLTTSEMGKPGRSLVVWLGLDVEWNCGSCFWEGPSDAFGGVFQTQIAFGASPGDHGIWSDTVVGHEAGHWVMESYGYDPGEGGPHFQGVPTLPGQAWSEGFATFFSSAVRSSSIYLDRASNGLWWFDLETRSHDGTPWSRPKPSGGLTQRLDENEVAATLWELSEKGKASKPLFSALASPRMTKAPFARGYYRHTWDIGSDKTPTNVRETNRPAPFLADFLDALNCSGFSRARLEAVLQPATYYPYPVHAPLCQ